jgi:hypothetical protein
MSTLAGRTDFQSSVGRTMLEELDLCDTLDMQTCG